jgi:hypothetical protein
MPGALFPVDEPDVSVVGQDPDFPNMMKVHRMWVCHRCGVLVYGRRQHRDWHRAVDSTSTAVVGTPSERAKQ